MSEATAVARLFVALPVAGPVSKVLSTVQPARGEAVRLLAVDDWHVTLHFLGARAIEPVHRALQSVRAASFSVRLERPGSFSLPGGRVVLIVGVEATTPLLALHREVARALERIGFVPERRPYRPHVTLARVAAGAPAQVAADFTESPLPAGDTEIACREFALYESVTAPEGVRYRIVGRFPLAASS